MGGRVTSFPSPEQANNRSGQLPPDELLTVEEVAQLLKVKRSYVYHLTSTDGIPYIKMGNHLRFHRSEIDAWLAAQSRGSSQASVEEGR